MARRSPRFTVQRRIKRRAKHETPLAPLRTDPAKNSDSLAELGAGGAVILHWEPRPLDELMDKSPLVAGRSKIIVACIYNHRHSSLSG